MQPFNFDEIINKAKRAEGDPATEQRVRNEAIGSLTAEQKRRLENVLNDPKELERLLSSPRAKDIIKKFEK